MRIKIKRRVRTSSSEQWALFDADVMDENEQPTNIGKADVHYDPEMVFVTMLLWSEFTETLDETTVQQVIDEIMDEITEPVGAAADFSLDFFTPSLKDYKFQTSLEDEEEWDEAEEEEEDEEPHERNGKNPWN
ncbi:MAG: hypothetical protein HXX08_04260 [Chloroflexi bacterium]|uniref:Uncharacterized protein n=1 Tax=Candidatus Chlorohelix allophototropha TaxID=3003348 RepID=A0A8T7LSS5_9CHLR|nr:hypothetical protein [Chloroflexota bacterium]WJW66954.1 hypothetical protein OZ401_000200 [Chloroflexota bacterium L227-S17]